MPATYLFWYRQGAQRYQLGVDGWAMLAGVGFAESDHGRDGSTSSAGAAGPMQFMPATWLTNGLDGEGDGDGDRDINDPADAIVTAAAYLRRGGAPDDWTRAFVA